MITARGKKQRTCGLVSMLGSMSGGGLLLMLGWAVDHKLDPTLCMLFFAGIVVSMVVAVMAIVIGIES